MGRGGGCALCRESVGLAGGRASGLRIGMVCACGRSWDDCDPIPASHSWICCAPTQHTNTPPVHPILPRSHSPHRLRRSTPPRPPSVTPLILRVRSAPRGTPHDQLAADCVAWVSRRCVRLRACWRGCTSGWGGATWAVACMVRGGVSRVRGRAMWCGPTCVNARVRACVCDHPSLLRAPRAPCFCSAVLAVGVARAAVALGCMRMGAMARGAAGGGAMQGGLSSAPRRSGVRSDRASRVRMRVVGRGARRGGRRDASWARMQAGGV
jgi:hypothetical protein